MSPPIRDGSGNSIGAIRLGDGSEISEVRTGAGDVLFSGSAIPDSVIHHWPMDEGSGSNFADVEGSADVSDFNGTWTSNNDFNGGAAPNFDQSDDLATASPQTPTEFTWAVRIRPDSLGTREIFSIFAHDPTPRLSYNGFNETWEFRDNNGDFINFSESASSFNGNIRYFIASLDGSGKALYQYDNNKNQINSETSNTSDQTYASNTLVIGSETSGGDEYWGGEIDNAYFFDAFLTSSERDDVLAEI
jgi:hypothetical protein